MTSQRTLPQIAPPPPICPGRCTSDLTVFSSAYDGSGRTEIAALGASQHFSLAVLDDWVYYSDWQRKIIGIGHPNMGSDKNSTFKTDILFWSLLIMPIIKFLIIMIIM